MVAGMWIGTLPVGMLAKAYGRRFALQTGSAFGVLSGLISCAAVLHGSFWLLLVGTLCGGLYAAAHQSYRFAATDTASPQFRPKAVAWVLAGGIFAAVIGLAARHLHQGLHGRLICSRPPILGAVGLRGARRDRADVRSKFRRPPVSHSLIDGRPLSTIVVQPKFIVAVVCGLASYSMMNMVMTSAPLAMVDVQPLRRRGRARHPMARASACMRRASSPAR